MWNRVYAALLISAIIVTGFFVLYAGTWLNSIGSPRDAFEGFLYYSRFSQISMWLSAAVLIVVANIVLWVCRRAWAIWMTLLFAVIFTFARFAWLDDSALGFARQNALPTAGLQWGFLMALIAAAAATGIAYFDLFLVSRLRDRMHPASLPATPAAEPAIPSEQPSSEE